MQVVSLDWSLHLFCHACLSPERVIQSYKCNQNSIVIFMLQCCAICPKDIWSEVSPYLHIKGLIKMCWRMKQNRPFLLAIYNFMSFKSSLAVLLGPPKPLSCAPCSLWQIHPQGPCSSTDEGLSPWQSQSFPSIDLLGFNISSLLLLEVFSNLQCVSLGQCDV